MYMISQPAHIFRRLTLIAVIAVAAAACSSQPSVAPAAKMDWRDVVEPRTPTPIGERAAAVAIGQLGVPYRYGGSSPNGFDCSGLVHYAYSNVGMSIPRTTAGLWSDLAPIDNRQLRVGDLLFFRIEGKMSHVGMYLGSRKFVHAPSSGRHVSVASLDSEFYRRAFIRAGRPE